MKISDLFKAKKKAALIEDTVRMGKADEVAKLFNTLKKGCETDDEMDCRMSMLKERMIDDLPLIKRKEQMEHDKALIELAKTLDDNTLEKMKKMSKMNPKVIEQRS